MTALYEAPWLQEQLAHSLGMLEGAWAALPEERYSALPPGRLAKLSSWPAQLHLYHLYIYERITVDYAAYWLPDGAAASEAEQAEHIRLWQGQEEDWQQLSAAETWAEMQAQRQELLARLAGAADWDARYDVFWGEQNLRWVAAKCFQHTLEHTTTLLQLAIFWDRFA
ncbi:MAG: DinB family protein [Anaerolineaceae bacterium]|nr:DinB family protein [Anaerolineaceae bacterium]